MAKKRVDVKNSQIVVRSAYTSALQTINKGKYCPFCNEKNLFKHHKEPVLYSGKHWLATNNNWPYEGTKKHFVFIHRKHVEHIERVSPAAWAELQKVYTSLCKKFVLKGATIFIRSGEMRLTGATVRHLHAQVVMGSMRTPKTEAIRAVVGFKIKTPVPKQVRG